MLEYLCITLPVCVLAVAHLLHVRYLNQQLQESLEQRLEDRIKERTRIARELHDSFGGRIACAHRPKALFACIAREN